MIQKARKILIGSVILVAATVAQEPGQTDDADWPRMLGLPGNGRLVVHAPQLESWKVFAALEIRAALTVEGSDADGEPVERLGSMRMRLRTAVDLAGRKALVSDPEMLELEIPGLDEARTRAVSQRLIRYVNSGSPEVRLDDLLSALDPSRLSIREVDVDTTPPQLIVSDEAALLIAFDGEPRMAPIEGTDLLLAMNSPSLLFQQTRTGWWYMMGWGTWIKTSDLKKGPWVPAPTCRRCMWRSSRPSW